MAVPSAPTDVVATVGDWDPMTGTPVTVTWTASPDEGDSGVTGYHITGTSGAVEATNDVDGFTTAALFTGLTYEVPWVFTVHATNADGDSPESDPSEAVTIPPPPDPPAPPPPPAAVTIPSLTGNGAGGGGEGGGGNAFGLGQDIDCFDDLNPQMRMVGGFANLGQALAHRLTTPRGTLADDPDYGTDTRMYLNAALPPTALAQLRGQVQAECRKDERVQSCQCAAVLNGSTLQLNLNVGTSAGPFVLLLAVTSVSVTLLQPAGAA